MKGAPRIYGIPATGAPVVAVIRRGPSEWAHVGAWDVARGLYTPGAWLRGRIFPRRSDLSPDGRVLCYFAHQPRATWEHGDAYVALSKLPWLTALHAFGTCGTWTRGYHFTEPAAHDETLGARPPIPFGLAATPIEQFATERRRGWEEAPGTPPREPRDTWDTRRNVRMRKCQPGGARWLTVESVGEPFGAFGEGQSVDGLHVRYALAGEGEPVALDDVQWADWSSQGHLVVATRRGALELRQLDPKPALLFHEDLSELRPEAAPAPESAGHW